MKSPRTIMITGAGSGLGAALALEYAAPGRNLVLAVRRPDRARAVERQCAALGATVVLKQLDICATERIEDWLDAVEQATPIDLLIANAGIFCGHGADGRMEAADEVARQIATNLTGTIATVSAVARRMKARRRGQIALVSSLAAIQPLADAPVYSATKAGLMAYGDALREYLAADRVTVSTILPGHIATGQTAVHAGRLVGVLSPERAARIIRTRLGRGRAVIAFPLALQVLVRLGRLLPWRVRAWGNRPFRFHVQPVADGDVGLERR